MSNRGGVGRDREVGGDGIGTGSRLVARGDERLTGVAERRAAAGAEQAERSEGQDEGWPVHGGLGIASDEGQDNTRPRRRFWASFSRQRLCTSRQTAFHCARGV